MQVDSTFATSKKTAGLQIALLLKVHDMLHDAYPEDLCAGTAASHFFLSEPTTCCQKSIFFWACTNEASVVRT